MGSKFFGIAGKKSVFSGHKAIDPKKMNKTLYIFTMSIY